MKTGKPVRVRAAVGGFTVLAAAATVIGGCQSTEPAGRRHTSSPAATPKSQPPNPRRASAAQLKAVLLSADDLPAGFIERPLTSRNLPAHLTGCQPLQDLMAGGAQPQEQVEFFRPPFGPWVDEAITRPTHGSAKETTTRLAAALTGCGAVRVTEEGHHVTLTLSPAKAPQAGDSAHAWRASGRLRGLRLQMSIVLASTGRSVVLVTSARLGGTAGPDLTDQVAVTAARKAARA